MKSSLGSDSARQRADLASLSQISRIAAGSCLRQGPADRFPEISTIDMYSREPTLRNERIAGGQCELRALTRNADHLCGGRHCLA